MGPHNILAVLHHDHAVQHSQIVLQNHPGPVFLGWRERAALADHPHDEDAGGEDHRVLGLVLTDVIFQAGYDLRLLWQREEEPGQRKEIVGFLDQFYEGYQKLMS